MQQLQADNWKQTKQCLEAQMNSMEIRFSEVQASIEEVETRLRAEMAAKPPVPLFDHSSFREGLIADMQKMCDSKVKVLAGAPASLSRTSFSVAPPLPVPASARFVARKVFIKGFCEFGKDSTDGISTEEAGLVGAAMVGLLAPPLRTAVEKILAPFFKNRQITLILKEDSPPETAWEMVQNLNEAIKSGGHNVGGRPIYAVADAEKWKKDRNAALAKAHRTLVDEYTLQMGDRCHLDWAGGVLYHVRGSDSSALGCWHRSKGWIWHHDQLRKIWSGIDGDALDVAMNW